MKPSIALTAALLLAATPNLHAQGSLTPPAGVPAPVMKTLDQIEARTPLVAGAPGVNVNSTTGTITISQTGSYYLTGNLTVTTAAAHGLVIAANDVTLDLNGFSLICMSVNGGTAIDYGVSKGPRIRDGSIVGGTTEVSGNFSLAGWQDGITGSGNGSPDISNLVIRGIRGDGVRIGEGYSGKVSKVVVDACGGAGILISSNLANVLECFVTRVGGTGISAGSGVVSSCSASSSGLNAAAILGGTVSNSTGTGGGAGVSAGTAINCQGFSGGGTGLGATTATNCTGTSFTGVGLSSYIASGCSGTSTNGVGLSATSATHSSGDTQNGQFGMSIQGTASYCVGSALSGTAISAAMAIGCTSLNGPITSPSKHLGTP